MFYHVLIRAKAEGKYKEMFELDIKNEDEVLEDIVIPYLQDEEFLFDGYFIKRDKIERIEIKLTEEPSKVLSEYENNNMPSDLIMYVSKEDVVGYERHSKDITKNLLSSAAKELQTSKKENNKVENFIDRSKVFIVHGHDELAEGKVARFVEKLGLEAIILHEQANRGQTIIEKIERYSNVGFGIVLYTPCDVGAKKEEEPQLQPRARQNVVFEHGFLMGKIGRSNVCALVKGGVETPNDISGVVYITMDQNDSWKSKLAKEMRESGYNIDMNKI
ncbi:TIR domain-containing protein [Jeotgalibacillus soli]|uniref:CD-NTase-associated protein 12/Pycsar effector protein TIR domain-containing protein n=1 Tax=Jeotgalibacillus soli TaxID=889306 RepID=A0A0C2R4I7_9BACL|nr:nucleotide-binding protein [Jeotgalibacillus soli]KIL45170.1 hypothetical protein KP78_27140 [Jeotgalibacillus soli]